MTRMLMCVALISILPEISNANEKPAPFMERQALFTNGQEGYVRYRIPSLLVTKRGTLLAFAEGRKKTGSDWDDIDLAMRRSEDGGQTWSDIEFIADQGELTMGNPCPVVDQSTGTIWMLFCRGSKPGRGNAHVLVIRSTDDGETWSDPVDITPSAKDPAWPFVGTGPGHGIQLKSGRLLIPCWADATQKIGEIQFSFCIYSDDHGITWQRGTRLTLNASDECDVVELENGTVYLNARSRQRKRQRAWAISRDGGHSWTDVRYDAAQPEPSCDGAVLRFTDSESFKKSRVLVSCPANPNRRDHLTIRMSYDECQNWHVAKLVDPGDSAYSDLAVTDDKTVLCLYETSAGIRLIRFNVEWLTDGEDSLVAR